MYSKVINGKMYNTLTAKLLASYDNGLSYTDFDYHSSDLYRKRTGEYFLYIQDGRANCSIRPITESEAKEWAERHCDGDEYVAIFGNVEE